MCKEHSILFVLTLLTLLIGHYFSLVHFILDTIVSIFIIGLMGSKEFCKFLKLVHCAMTVLFIVFLNATYKAYIGSGIRLFL